jgi:hypothetical protein
MAICIAGKCEFRQIRMHRVRICDKYNKPNLRYDISDRVQQDQIPNEGDRI